MNAFIKDVTRWEVPTLQFIKQNDPFMCLKCVVSNTTLVDWAVGLGCFEGGGAAFGF